jgi:hypothetical protein
VVDTKKKSLGFGVPKGVVSTTHSQRGREPALLHSVLHKKMYKKIQKDPPIRNPNPTKNKNQKSKNFLQFLSQLCLSLPYVSLNISPSLPLMLSVFGSFSPLNSLSLSLSKKAKEKRKEMNMLEKKKKSNKKMEMM